jgi:GGDEF domain-containing protein
MQWQGSLENYGGLSNLEYIFDGYFKHGCSDQLIIKILRKLQKRQDCEIIMGRMGKGEMAKGRNGNKGRNGKRSKWAKGKMGIGRSGKRVIWERAKWGRAK